MLLRPETLQRKTESMAKQFLESVEPLTSSFLDNSLDKLKNSSSVKRIKTAMFIALLGSGFAFADGGAVNAQPLPKREATPLTMSGENLLKANDVFTTLRFDGGPVIPDPESNVDDTPAISPEQQTQTVEAAQRLIAAMLTEDEKTQLEALAVQQGLGPDEAITIDLPATVAESTLQTTKGSIFDTLLENTIRDANIAFKDIPRANPNIPVARLMIFRHQEGNLEKAIPVVGLNQDLKTDHLVTEKTLIIFAPGGKLRYLDISNRTINNQVVATDKITVIQATQEIADKLLAEGVESVKVGDFMLVQMSTEDDGTDPAGTIESLLTEEKAISLYNPTTGTPDRTILGVPISSIQPEAVAEAPIIAPVEVAAVPEKTPANFNVKSIPSANLIINPDGNGHFFDGVSTGNVGGLPTDAVQNYGSTYKFVLNHQQLLDVGGAYQGALERDLNAAWDSYAKDVNAQYGNGQEVLGVAAFLDGQKEFIAYQALADFNMPTLIRGQEIPTQITKGSVVMLDDNKRAFVIPVSENTFVGVASGKNVLNSLILGDKIPGGETSFQFTPGLFADLSQIRDEDPSVFVLIPKDSILKGNVAPGSGHSVAIVAMQPYGTPTAEANQGIPPTAEPTAVPASTPFTSEVKLVTTEGDVSLPGEAPAVTDLSPEQKATIEAALDGLTIDAGFTATITDGNHSKELTITLSGMPGATDLKFSRSVIDSLKEAGYKFDTSKERIEFIVLPHGIPEAEADKLGLETRLGGEQQFTAEGGQAGLIWAYAKQADADGTKVSAVIVSNGFLQKFIVGWTDQNGDPIPIETTFGYFMSSALDNALMLQQTPKVASGALVKESSYARILRLNGLKGPAFMTVNLPDSQN